MKLALLLALAASTDPAPARGWGGWCPKLYRGIAPGVCLAADASTFEPGHLIVYFHGMLEKATYANPELTTLAQQALKRRYAVVALAGQRGLCTWGAPYDTWACWPTDRSQLPDVGRQLARVGEALVLVGSELKHNPGTPLVVGFSNGGFFSVMLATETRFEVAAWAVLHAGPVTGLGFPASRRRPMLLVMAQQDSVQFPRMVALADALKAAGWSPTVVSRAGDHELVEQDVTATLDFFDAQLKPRARPPFRVVPPPSGASP